jgi:molybdopterin converting factor subunit 1
MKVELLYFAAARDVVGKARETAELPGGVGDIRQFIHWLVQRYPELGPHQASLRIAKNEAFARSDEAIANGDVLAIIPPVAGG